MPKKSVCYTLFLYREELRRPDTRILNLSKTKIKLTDRLISKIAKNIDNCTMEDLKIINREIEFRKELKSEIKRLRKLKKLGIWDGKGRYTGQSTEL